MRRRAWKKPRQPCIAARLTRPPLTQCVAQACLEGHGSLCPECGDRPIPRYVVSTALDAICSKHEVKLSALQALHASMQRALAPPPA